MSQKKKCGAESVSVYKPSRRTPVTYTERMFLNKNFSLCYNMNKAAKWIFKYFILAFQSILANF